MIKKYLIEINVDEDHINEKYPNYSINWDSPEEFIEATLSNIESTDENNEYPSQYYNEWGYSVQVLDELGDDGHYT